MKKGFLVRIFETAGCFITAVVLVFLFYGGLALHVNPGQILDVSDGWKVRKGEKTYVNISLDDMSYVFKDMKKHDTFSMSHSLNVQSHDPLVLRVYSRLSAIAVMVDNRQIYSYGFLDVSKDRMVGSGYHFVMLPSSYYGKKLTIVMEASMDDAIISAPEIVITPADDAIFVFSRERIFGIFAGLFMVIAGFALIILSVPAVYMDRRFYPLAVIGLFSCASGIWCLSSIKALQLFSGDVTLNSILEYLAMYFLPVPALFLSSHFRQGASPRIKKFIGYIGMAATAFFFIALFLHVSGIMSVAGTVKVYHVLLVPIILTLVFAGTSKWRKLKSGIGWVSLGFCQRI